MDIIKKFIPFYKAYKKVFFLDLICAGAISLIDILYPQILRGTINGIFALDKEMIFKSLPVMAVGLFVMYSIQALCKRYVSYQGHVMGSRMERDMRRQLFEHYEKLSFSYYDRNNSGQLMSRLVSDLFDIAEMAHHAPENFFISLVKLVGSFIFLFIISWELAFVLFALVICMFVVALRQRKRMRDTFMDNRQKIGDINASLQDTLAGIRVVQAFGNEDIEREKFEKNNHRYLLSKIDNYRCMGDFTAGTQFFQGMMYLATLVFGGMLIANHRMSVTDLSMYALYIGIFVSPIQVLVELTEMIQKGFSGFRRFIEVTETDTEIKDAPGAAELCGVSGRVEFDHVSFRYKEDESAVLQDVSFVIPAGKSVALVGPSGAGKSTICSLLPRFYDTCEGRVMIDGLDVRDLTLKSLRSHIGIVQQDVYLFDGTISENISYGRPDASREEIIKAAKMADIHVFIESLPDGYDTWVGERGVRLSGGQKQRISIARVFLKNPPILILDEATSSLDNESERCVQESLDKLAKGRTTLTIAHRLSTIQNAEEILVISKHGIAERGTHKELLRSDGIYARYFEMSR